MANHALAERSPSLIGEIIEGRYAVLELLGGDRYLVFDMKELRQTVMPLGNNGAVLHFEGVATATGQPAAAPSTPVAAPLPRLAPLRSRTSLPPLPTGARSRPPSGTIAPVLRSTPLPPPLPKEERALTPRPPAAAQKPLFRVVTDPRVPFDTRIDKAPASQTKPAPAQTRASAPPRASAPLALTQRKPLAPPPEELTQRKAPLALERVKTSAGALAAAKKHAPPAAEQRCHLTVAAPERPPAPACQPQATRREATPSPSLQRRRVDTHRFEAAWFSYGETLQQEEQLAEEVTDYEAYQSYLERIALDQA